jgi:hypothetical protein
MTQIYKIVSNNTQQIYIGVTDRDLTTRLRDHESSYKSGTWYAASFNIIKAGNYEITPLKIFDEILDLIKKKEEEKKIILEYIDNYGELVVNCEHNKKYGKKIRHEYLLHSDQDCGVYYRKYLYLHTCTGCVVLITRRDQQIHHYCEKKHFPWRDIR